MRPPGSSKTNVFLLMAETRNWVDVPEFAVRQKEAASLLSAQFPFTPHP